MSSAFKQGGYQFAIDDGYHDDLSDHSYELKAFTGVSPKTAPALKPLLKAKHEAVWVLGRLMSLYGIEPTDEAERGDEAMMECSLLAWPDGESADSGFPFFVSDDRGRTSIFFGKDTSKKVSKKIAQAFVQLLLADGDEIEDFSQTIGGDSSSALRFGIRSAAPFCVDATEDIEEDFGPEGDAFAGGGGGGGGKRNGDDDLFGLADDDDAIDDDDDDDLFGGDDDDDDDDDEEDDRGRLDFGDDDDRWE
ncbi:MAG: hypothetical protein ACI9NC_003627 [Verrucomicrobiales bacterium]|jgi:hypothetical protein